MKRERAEERRKEEREGEVPLSVARRREATELFSVAIISPSRARKRGARRGRLFLPPLLATEFPSRERERGEEREMEREGDKEERGDVTKRKKERERMRGKRKRRKSSPRDGNVSVTREKRRERG